MKKSICGWGRYPVIVADVSAPSSFAGIQEQVGSSEVKGGITLRGLGRSYGDSSLGARIIGTYWLNHMRSFDEVSGVLCCEAGVSLREILDVFVPKGWFLPVTPGTQFITVGGAVASDVHGKNHHTAGCFCDHVAYLDVLVSEDRLIRCSRDEYSDLFYATCGGMGLTGLVMAAAINLMPIASAYVDQAIFKARDLDESMDLFDAQVDAPYSVAWIDCLAKGRSLGRSLLMTGRHSEEGTLAVHGRMRWTVPMDMPAMLLNRHSMQAFNALYYHRVHGSSSHSRVHYEPYFYPLDSIGSWNRLYGRRGFIQYQFVIPKESGITAMRDILRVIVASEKSSFLAGIKAFGPANGSLLGFPMEGYTLGLDMKLEAGLFELLDRLDSMVVEYGGRIYLTKDARMSETAFRKGYPRLDEFAVVRDAYGTKGRFISSQSIRLGLE